MQNNLVVHSDEFPDKPFEFELTTNDHFKRETRTVTAMFKTCSDGPHLLEAWRILIEAVGQLAIMPRAVDLEELRIQQLVRTLLLDDQALEKNPEASGSAGQALPRLGGGSRLQSTGTWGSTCVKELCVRPI